MPQPNANSIREQFAPVMTDPKETTKRFLLWCKYFFGDPNIPEQYWIRADFSIVHPDICEMALSGYKYVLLSTPRGVAKTTLVAILMTVYRIVYNMERFIVVIGKGGDEAKENIGNIRDCLAINPKIKAVYGDLMPKGRKAKSNEAKREDNAYQLTLVNGIRLRCIGMRGKIRGRVKVYRPTLIVIEDPQDINTMKEVTTLEQHQRFVEQDVIYSMDPLYGKLIIIGNNLGIGCTVNNMIKDTRFVKYILDSMYDENGNSIWEANYPTQKLKDEEKRMRSLGKGHVFDAERMNIPDDSLQKRIEGYKFHNNTIVQKDGINYLISDVYPRPIRVHLACLIDPAFSEAKSADKRAKVIAAIGEFPQETDGTVHWIPGIWILDYRYDHSDPSMIPEWIMQQHESWSFDYMVIEANGGQVIFKYMIQRGLMKNTHYRQKPFTPIYVNYQANGKGDRIWNTIGLMCSMGQFFVKSEHVDLIGELDNFGYLIRKRGIHLLDAAQMGMAYVPIPPTEKEVNIGMVVPKRLLGNVEVETKRTKLYNKLRKRGKAWQIW